MRWMRKARDAKGMTLDELSGITGIRRETLNRYELGKQAPSFERGVLVARALGVSLDSVACEERAIPESPGTEVAA